MFASLTLLSRLLTKIVSNEHCKVSTDNPQVGCGPSAALPAAGAGQRRGNDATMHNPPERWLQRTGCGWKAGSARGIGRGLCWMLNGSWECIGRAPAAGKAPNRLDRPGDAWSGTLQAKRQNSIVPLGRGERITTSRMLNSTVPLGRNPSCPPRPNGTTEFSPHAD